MAIVSMSGTNKKRVRKPAKKVEVVEPAKIMQPDGSWYNATLCKKCPYLEMDDVAQMARCHKPYDESCLGQSILVQAALYREQYINIACELDEIDAKLTDDVDSCVKVQPSQKPFVSRRKKPIKNRRG